MNAQGATKRATSDKIVACRSRYRLKIWVYAFGCTQNLGACVRATNRYGIIFIGIWHHIYWNMTSYLLGYDIIFIGMWHHIYWNMASHKLEYAVIFIVICSHIALLEYVVISFGICCHIYWNI